ncbi:MAG: bifunctional folylpolyglutamate synthase/dihydrofolate synthase [Anaerorhabdus sp.]
MFKSYEEAVAWVMSQRNQGSGLEQFKNLMSELGNPQDRFKTIHITGTNGKGSTVQFVCDLLQETGLKVGMFTSPYLVSHRDRFRINGKWIPETVFLELVNENLARIKKYQLGMFEIDTMIMFLYFKREKVDFGIIEVGIGGRRDCTNCMSFPIVSAIVSIGRDHKEILGDTEEEIAYEKAGIIQIDGCCVVGTVSSESLAIIQKEAELKKAEIHLVQRLNEKYKLASQALYQQENASVALGIIEQLEKRALITLTPEQKKNALERSVWEGRYEVLSENPKVILDGAHNVDGMRALCTSLKQETKPITIIFAALKDKEANQMIDVASQVVDTVIVTEFDFYRSRKKEDYEAEKLKRYSTFEEAYKKAKELSKQSGTICICGSLYFVSETRKSLKKLIK